MTTIVIDEKTRTMYIDRQITNVCSNNEINYIREADKFHYAGKHVVSGAGILAIVESMCNAFNRVAVNTFGFGIAKSDKDENIDHSFKKYSTVSVVLSKNKYVIHTLRMKFVFKKYIFFVCEKTHVKMFPGEEIISIGSGSTYAHDYLNTNKLVTPDEIFAYVSKHDDWTSSNFDVIKL